MIEKKKKVLIVDDSTVYRQLIRDVLNEEEDFEVVSQAGNGKLALPRVKFYRPDFVILDHEMPVMDGLETLQHIHNDNPESMVVMFSSHTVQGAKVTVKALEMGAIDFVTKPEGTEDASGYIKRKLVKTLRDLYRNRTEKVVKKPIEPAPVIRAPRPRVPLPTVREGIAVVGIGISTGGPVALRELFHLLRPPYGGSLLIVQHMPPLFTKQLAASLDSIGTIPIQEASDGDLIQPGHAYLAPGGYHMKISEDHRIELSHEPPVNNCKPSVDVLFRSLAQHLGPKSAGVIMTGMGQDGYEGMKAMYDKHCNLLAQSKESCLVYGMPARPIEEGLVDGILDIEAIADRINTMLRK